MIGRARRAAAALLRRGGWSAVRQSALQETRRLAETGAKAQRLGMVPDGELRQALEVLPESRSQLNQDVFVLSRLGWKRGGYFVEFGATDGKTLNNTWLLETRFGWTGILAEPARGWREPLQAAGRTAALDFDCVWSRSGERLAFAETGWKDISTLAAFAAHDGHDRRASRRYQVRTVSLGDLLARHGAPPVIDYLSIDTEGSELEILGAFDFAAHRFRCITCEHNFTAARAEIHALLSRHGYRRVFEELSGFDDWYVSEDT